MAEPLQPRMYRKTLLGGTEETTSGTAATVSAAFTLTTLVEDSIKIVPVDFFADNIRRPPSAFFSRVKAMAGRQAGRLTFTVECRNADYTAKLLTGCGFVVSAGVYTFTNDMSARKTWSFAVWQDGRRLGIKGAAGTCKFRGGGGQRLFADFDFIGAWIPPIDEAMPSQAPSVHVPSYMNSALTLTLAAAAIPCADTYTIDLGTSVQMRPCLTSGAGGILHYFVAEFEPMLTLDPEARLIAALDQFGIMLASTTVALNLVVTLSAGNTLAFTAPAVQLMDIQDGNRNRIRTDAFTASLNSGPTGNDALTITEVTT